MARTAIIAANLLLFSILSPAIAQRGGRAQAEKRAFGGSQLPAPGTMLPSVSAVDQQGEKFSTASLRGSYTVLVFGCLT